VQLEKFIGHPKLRESDVFHYSIDLDPYFIALGPFFLYFFVGFSGHFNPILNRFPHVVDATFH
jgi:hypothetical protein